MYGPATVREILARLAVEPPLAYTTVMTICVRLSEKGLLERQRIDGGERGAPVGHPYCYAPAIGEEAFVRTAVAARLAELQEHFPALFDTPPSPRLRANAQTDRPQIERLLAYLGGLRQDDGCATNDAALDQIAALLERAEAAERKATAWEIAARRAERQLVQVERRSRRATARPDQQKTTRELARAAADVPYEIPTGACRVCGQPALPPHRRRSDGLRVCSNRACRTEARRRDNNAKQRRYNERQQFV
jgi:hypothetical protein